MVRKTIAMPDAMGAWVAGRIQRGQYNNESEYFRDLVRRDQEEEAKRDHLMARFERGEAQLVQGEYADFASDQDIDRLFGGDNDGGAV